MCNRKEQYVAKSHGELDISSDSQLGGECKEGHTMVKESSTMLFCSCYLLVYGYVYCCVAMCSRAVNMLFVSSVRSK